MVATLRCSVLLAWLVAAGAALGQPAAPAPPQPPPMPLAAKKVRNVIEALQEGEQESGRGEIARCFSFEFTEADVNAYAQYALQVRNRPGVRALRVKVFPKNYLSTLTTIDFDAVEKMKPGTIPTLLKPVLRGQKQIWLDCRFQTANGRLTFRVEKAYFEKLRLPAFFVEKMIEIVAARQPEKYDTTKPLLLPFGLRHLSTRAQRIAGQN